MATPDRRRRHEDEEEHENHERWLVTYADMLTLLMVLFIVMFAMSQVDEKKYSALRSGLADGFGQDSSYMKGSDSILEAEGNSHDHARRSPPTPPTASSRPPSRPWSRPPPSARPGAAGRSSTTRRRPR